MTYGWSTYRALISLMLLQTIGTNETSNLITKQLTAKQMHAPYSQLSLSNMYYINIPYFILAKGSAHEGGNMINQVLAIILYISGLVFRIQSGEMGLDPGSFERLKGNLVSTQAMAFHRVSGGWKQGFQ